MKLSPVGQLIALDDIGVDRGGIPVLRGVNLNLDESRVVGVAGLNGSGKTTLLRLIATLLAPSSGAGRVLDTELGSPGVYNVRDKIGMISHIPAILPELTQRENLVHFSKLSGADTGQVEKLLQVVGLDEAADRRADASSFGMQRRVEVARLLMTNPMILLLDEAFSGLDSEAQELIGALIGRTRSKGGAVVMVSHDATQLKGHADSVLNLRSGRLEEMS